MTTQLITASDYIKAAKAAILAGDLDEAEQHKTRAVKLRELEALEPEATKAAPAPVRPPYVAQGGGNAPDSENIAVKTWYIRKYKTLEDGAKAIARDLYGTDYEAVTYAKHQAFRQFLRTGECRDPALKGLVLYTPDQLMELAWTGEGWSAAKATQIEVQDSLGGFSVPEDFRTDIVERLPGLTVVRPLANVMQTSRDLLTMVKRTGGNSRYIGAARVTWVDESPSGASASATNTTFGKVQIPVNVTLANIPVSRSILEDSAIDIVQWIKDEVTVAMAIDEDEKFLVGDGLGKPQGVLNGTSSGGPFDSNITTVNSGSNTALTPDKIVAVPMNLDGQYRASPSCVWVAAKETYLAIYQLKDANGRYLWRNFDDNIALAYPKTLQGYQIKESQAMPTSITQNGYPIIFGDFKRGYTVADRIGMSLERYQDSNTVNQDTVIFYARRRLGGQVVAGWAFVVQKVST